MPHVELPQAEFKVVMLGNTNAGKTSLVLRFAEGHYRDQGRSPTVGAFFITKRIQTSNGITCKIQIWDTAGQTQFRAMAPMYYRNAAAAIVCYDVTSQHSYKVMREWLDELHQNVTAGNIVIAIAATKNDLAYSADPGSLVPTAEAEELAATLGAIFVDTSAKNNSHVNDLFQRVAERVLHFRKHAQTNGLDGERSIPVTPGASIDEQRKTLKGRRYSERESMNVTVASDTLSIKTTQLDDSQNENVDSSKESGLVAVVDETEQLSEKSTIMCEGSLTTCGVLETVGNRDNHALQCTVS